MGDGERPAPDYDKALGDLIRKPGSEEGVTPEMDALRAGHELPDADVAYRELEDTLDRIGIEHFQVSPPAPTVIDRDPTVQAAEAVISKERVADDAELITSEQTETFADVINSIKALGLELSNDMSAVRQKLERRGDEERLSDLKTLFNDVVDVAREIVGLQSMSREQAGAIGEMKARDVLLAHRRRLLEVRASFHQHFSSLIRASKS